MFLPTLYKRTSKGAIQEWRVEFTMDKFRTHEGLVGCKITISEWTICEGKNIGRANATSPVEQARKEAQSKWQHKLDGGYKESVEDIDTKDFFPPMLAKKWRDYKDKVIWPVYTQPKLDGKRCVISQSGMWSRNGKPIKSALHIYDELKQFLVDNKYVFDGELYTHKFSGNFEKIISLASQLKPTIEDLEQSKLHLEYWCYDIYVTGQPLMIFEDRSVLLSDLIISLGKSPVKYVSTVLVNNQVALDSYYEQYRENAYEGQMIRVPNSPYQCNRSDALLKRKEFIDEEFLLINILEGKGGHTGIASSATLVTKDGREFDAGIIGDHPYCRKLFINKNKFINKQCTVVYQNLTGDGIPRFAKLKYLNRNYE